MMKLYVMGYTLYVLGFCSLSRALDLEKEIDQLHLSKGKHFAFPYN